LGTQTQIPLAGFLDFLLRSAALSIFLICIGGCLNCPFLLFLFEACFFGFALLLESFAVF
jgi:hypothetical protein